MEDNKSRLNQITASLFLALASFVGFHSRCNLIMLVYIPTKMQPTHRLIVPNGLRTTVQFRLEARTDGEMINGITMSTATKLRRTTKTKTQACTQCRHRARQHILLFDNINQWNIESIKIYLWKMVQFNYFLIRFFRLSAVCATAPSPRRVAAIHLTLASIMQLVFRALFRRTMPSRGTRAEILRRNLIYGPTKVEHRNGWHVYVNRREERPSRCPRQGGPTLAALATMKRNINFY